jgi:uncharacterized membrane protein
MIKNCIIRIWEFYRDGFREMTLGRTLWMLILVKLFIMFFILKLFFFSSFLKDKTDEEKQQYVGSELVNRSSNSIIK